MRAVALLVVAFLLVSCIDTKPIFSIKEDYPRDEIKATHKKVAVFPVNYVANIDTEDVIEKMLDTHTDPFTRQEQKANKYQSLIYEELYKANPNTDWLGTQVTNRILKEKNINFQNISQLSKSEIAAALQVDAVIYCDFLFKTESVSKGDVKETLNAKQNNNKKNVVEVSIEIYSTLADDLIWKAHSTVSRQKIYSPVLFRELISRQLEPVLPFN